MQLFASAQKLLVTRREVSEEGGLAATARIILYPLQTVVRSPHPWRMHVG